MASDASEFEAWLRAPLAASPDLRFDVRRATVAEFDRIYEVIDQAFARPRPRALYDWLYRRNPMGVGRCWLVSEKRSGRLVGSAAMWPWPIARAAEPLRGMVDGDSAVLPDWQRMGVNSARRRVSECDPWLRGAVRLAWPNEGSRGSRSKSGFGDIAVPVPHAALTLDARRSLQRSGWPTWAALPGASAFDAFQRARCRFALRGHDAGIVEEVRRFDAAYDGLGGCCLGGTTFWSPHTSAFLNWRYLEHPTRTYVAFAVHGSRDPEGYGVLYLDPATALLMELVAPTAPTHIARALLARAIALARAAGAARLECIASPRWPHWPLLRRAGFVALPSDIRVWFLGHKESGVDDLDNWLLSAGDMDDR